MNDRRVRRGENNAERFTSTIMPLTQPSSVSGRMRKSCPVCESRSLNYEFVVDRAAVCGCVECGLLFLNPQPGPAATESSDETPVDEGLNAIYRANAVERMDQLAAYSKLEGGRLLLIGADAHMRNEAERRNFRVLCFDPAEIDSEHLETECGELDGCILFCSLERMPDPLATLQIIRGLLRENGALMIISPTTDSRTAQIFRASWWEFNRHNLFYFSVDTLQSLLSRAGFGNAIVSPDRSLLSLSYIRRRLTHMPRGIRYRLMNFLVSLSPGFLSNKAFRLLYTRMSFIVRSVQTDPQPKLSVIVPVYNERATFVELIEQLLAKEIDGVEIEVIIVESNSNDGTRELVLQYENHPRVQIILQEAPRGKGYAVRTGLKAAKGVVVLFQDADLEYDINDYDALIEPILTYRHNFIIGTRHGSGRNGWKMRQFSDAPALASIFNLGHLFFLTLFNLVYGQRLTDPFTMFKVFRRDCLYGLTFECNRFDFDHEIVIKLLRKGYKPVELPVNYRSRSIKEGKKVTMFRDPITWLRAIWKFRKSPLYGDTGPPTR
jgi:hypothetical protein